MKKCNKKRQCSCVYSVKEIHYNDYHNYANKTIKTFFNNKDRISKPKMYANKIRMVLT